jgi:hypothetical protein
MTLMTQYEYNIQHTTTHLHPTVRHKTDLTGEVPIHRLSDSIGEVDAEGHSEWKEPAQRRFSLYIPRAARHR